MNTEILGSVLQIVILLVFSYPLGKHKFSLVFLGNDIVVYPALAAVKSGREC